MKVDLMYQDGRSPIFWSIEVKDSKHYVIFCPIGISDRPKIQQFADADTAKKEALKLIEVKKQEGYKETTIKPNIIRNGYNFAGKPIEEFNGSLNFNVATKMSDFRKSIPQKLLYLSKLSDIKNLNTLVIGHWYPGQQELHNILKQLIKLKNKFSGLKHIFFGDIHWQESEMSWIKQGIYKDFYQHFPNLESFGVRGGQGLELGKIDLPNLKNLIVECTSLSVDNVKNICNSDLPNLEYLDLWVGSPRHGAIAETENLKPIFDGRFPKLKYLGLKNYYRQDELAESLRHTPVLKQIDVLDLSMGILRDEGAKALYYNDNLLRLQHINCSQHYISEEWQQKLKTKFAAQHINLDKGKKLPPDSYTGQWHYVAINE